MATQYQDIVIRVDARGAITVLNQAGDAVKKWDNANKAAAQGFSKFQANLLSMVASLNLAGIATRVVMNAIKAIPDAIERGSRVEDITENFNRMAGAAGAAGDALRKKFGDALGNTMSNYAQMRQMNELLIAQIDPSKFELLAKAARAIGEATGGTAAEGLNQLSDALLRGNTRGLKSIGIIIDQTKAIEDFARANGRSADEITDVGRAYAIREASLKALGEAQARIGEITDDAGDKIEQFDAALENAKDEFAKAAAANKSLNDALDALNTAINSINWSPIIDGLAKAISLTDQFTKYLAEGVQMIPGAISDIGNFFSDTLGWGDIAQQIRGFPELVRPVTMTVEELNSVLTPTNQSFNNMSVQLKKVETAGKPAGRVIDGLFGANKGAADKAKKLKDEIDGIRQQIEKLYKIGSYGQNLNVFTQIASEETKDNAADVAASMAKVAEALIRAGQPASQVAAAIAEAADSAKQLHEFTNQTASQFVNSRDTEKIGDSIGEDIGHAIGNAISDLATGGDIGDALGGLGGSIGSILGEDLGKELGASLGELGGEILGPVGGAIGGALGQTLVDGIVSAFGGGDSAGTKARKSVDKFFADLFEKNRILTIVNGELQSIKDMTFSGTTGAAFDALPAQSQAAFAAVGDAWEQILAEMGMDMDNLGYELQDVFANNIGGSIADLRAMIKALGKDAAEMADALMTAFMQGKVSAMELMQELQGLQSTMSAGIPEAVGAVGVAFERIAQAGWSGGAVLTDAIASVAVEAMELGASTMPQLQAMMVNTFGISEQAALQFINACTVAGVSSLEQLKGASDAVLTAIAANLQAAQQGLPQTFKPITFDAPEISAPTSGGISSAMKSTKNEAKETAKALRELVEETTAYGEIMEKVSLGEMSRGEAGKALKKLYKEVSTAQKDMTKAEEKLDNYLTKHKGANIQSLQLAKLELAVDKTTAAYKRLTQASKTAEEKAMDAFLAGKMTFEEAANQAGKNTGIEGYGNVLGAYKSLKDLGTKGGAFSVEALKAMAAEAMETGITSMNDMMNLLKNAGIPLKEVQDFMYAAQKTGLNDVASFLDISNEDAISFLGTLQAMKFPFAETSDEISKMLDKFDKLKNKKVTVDVELKIHAKYADEISKKYAKYANLGSAYASSGGPAY